MYLVINKWVITVKVSNFSGQYLRNHWTLGIDVLGYIGIVWPKEHSPEVWSVPPVTPCIVHTFTLFITVQFQCRSLRNSYLYYVFRVVREGVEFLWSAWKSLKTEHEYSSESFTTKKLAITAYAVNILFRVATNEIGPSSCLAAPLFASFFVNCVCVLLSLYTEIRSIALKGSRPL